jgi:hypothetical protein
MINERRGGGAPLVVHSVACLPRASMQKRTAMNKMMPRMTESADELPWRMPSEPDRKMQRRHALSWSRAGTHHRHHNRPRADA